MRSWKAAGGKRRWFLLDKVEPGNYIVVAHPIDNPRLSLAYTVESDPHKLGTVPVVAGQLTIGVNIIDLFSGDDEVDVRHGIEVAEKDT